MDTLIIDMGAIAGESTITGYVSKIEVLSFSHGISQQITGDQSNQKRTSGKPNHQDFTFTKFTDLATASLFDYCGQAKNLPTVTFYVLQTEAGATTPIWTVVLTNCLISSMSMGGGGGGKPQETVTLNYTAISWAYKQQIATVGDSGTASATWNLATNATS